MSFLAKLREFQTLGCEDPIKCALGCRVFQDLEEDPRVTNLMKCFDPELNTIYLRGDRNGFLNVFVPVLSTQHLELLLIEKLQNNLVHEGAKCITLAICDASSTVLYYQLTPDFVEKQ